MKRNKRNHGSSYPFIRHNLNKAQLRGCCSYKCNICEITISNKKEMRQHIMKRHGKEEALSDYYEAI